MRILYLTDTHLGIKRHFRGSPPGWERAHDHLATFQQALAAIDAPGEPTVQAVIHSGDLFDRSNPPADAVQAAVDALTAVAAKVPVYLMPGNHDRLGLARHFDGVPGLVVGDGPFRAEIGGARFAFVPFHREPAAWAHSAKLVAEPGCDVLVAHQAFDGATVGGYRFSPGVEPETLGEQHIPRGVPTILCGHIHPRQTRRVGGSTVIYPGSTERTAFSERGETKGYAILELGRTVQARFVDLPARPMAEIYQERDVQRVREGTLVRLAGASRTREIEAWVYERGGWVAPWKDESRQVGMFG